MNDIDERTLKIVELARNGADGERSNAQRILRTICAQQGLSYDDLMAGNQEEYGEHIIATRKLTKNERTIAAAIVVRFATSEQYPDIWEVSDRYSGAFRGYKTICTPAQAAEASYAVEVYIKAYRKELKKAVEAVQLGFILKNKLVRQYKRKDASTDDEMTEKEREQLQRAVLAGSQMDSVRLHKAITAGGGQ